MKSAIEPIKREAKSSHIKLSLAAYSFNRFMALKGKNKPTMTMDDFVDFAVGIGLFLVFPFLLYFSVFAVDGPFLPPTIGVVLPDHPAEGKLLPGDRIMAVGKEVNGMFNAVRVMSGMAPGGGRRRPGRPSALRRACRRAARRRSAARWCAGRASTPRLRA